MIILAIETSCDETSVAILKNKEVLSNVTISQILEHSKHGGVLPGLAARLHLKNIRNVFLSSLEKSGLKVSDIQYVAYTKEPGLIICLQIGKIIAETLSLFLDIPLIPCNHLLGHAYASLINKNKEWEFPALSLIISGGHTQIYKVSNHWDFKIVGETLDDAVGECLDKSAVIMGYNYPGGPVIEKLALSGQKRYRLPLPKNDKSLNFSFSGLKSEIKRILSNQVKSTDVNDLSFSLQESLGEILSKKMILALQKINPRTVVIGGGVISNKRIRSILTQRINDFNKDVSILIPDFEYCTDNAAMIGILAYYQLISNN